MPKQPRNESERLYRFYSREIRNEYRLQRVDHSFIQTMKIMDHFVSWFTHQRSPNAVMREFAWKSIRSYREK